MTTVKRSTPVGGEPLNSASLVGVRSMNQPCPAAFTSIQDHRLWLIDLVERRERSYVGIVVGRAVVTWFSGSFRLNLTDRDPVPRQYSHTVGEGEITSENAPCARGRVIEDNPLLQAFQSGDKTITAAMSDRLLPKFGDTYFTPHELPQSLRVERSIS